MNTSLFSRTFLASALTAFILFTGGCSHYKLGSTVPKELKNIAVPVFANDTEHDQVGGIVTRAIIEKLIEQGTFSVTSLEKSNLKVLGVVSDYSSVSIRYDRNRATNVNEYRMTLTATVDLVETATGKVLLAGKKINGRTTFTTRGDYRTGMVDAFPRAANDIATQLIDIIEGMDFAKAE